MVVLPDIRDIKNVSSIILAHVHSFNSMWFFTNHGVSHSSSVENYVEQIIKICDLCGIELNDAEKAILRCACWLHDIGRIREQNGLNHALESVNVIRILCDKGHLNLGAIKDEIEYVVSAHSSKGLPLANVEMERPISGANYNVRLKLLCALFKIADECDIDRLRAPKSVYDVLEDLMPESSRFHWVRTWNVIRVVLSYEERKIIIHIVEGSHEEDILESLTKTLKDERIKQVLVQYKFPVVDYCIQYHPPVDISQD